MDKLYGVLIYIFYKSKILFCLSLRVGFHKIKTLFYITLTEGDAKESGEGPRGDGGAYEGQLGVHLPQVHLQL